MQNKYPKEVLDRMNRSEWFVLFRPDIDLNINCQAALTAEEVFDAGFGLYMRMQFNPDIRGIWFPFRGTKDELYALMDNLTNKQKYQLVYGKNNAKKSN